MDSISAFFWTCVALVGLGAVTLAIASFPILHRLGSIRISPDPDSAAVNDRRPAVRHRARIL